MAHLHKKMKNGRPYFYIREIARVNGKPKVVNQVYLGTVEKILSLVTGQKSADLSRIQVQEFGALWLANEIEKMVGVTGIIDEIVPQKSKDSGPSVGEYFLYAAFNRMVDATSKRALPEWFSHTAIQSIRATDIQSLDSDGYWRKWGVVEEKHLRDIAQKLFARIAELRPSASGCYLFDTTNYFTFMASDTESELAKRGKNKEGRDWLRQVGLALLVDRQTRLPFFYREYEGNRHDSRLFQSIIDEVCATMQGCGQKDVTIVFDKGMNSPENICAIDATDGAHFITTYSPYFAEDLIHAGRDQFLAVETVHNRELKAQGREDDLLSAWRTTGEYWGRERTVVVTYNPLTATKQRYAFEAKLQKLQAALYEIRGKVREDARGWRQEAKVRERYEQVCEDLHLPKDLYDLTFERKDNQTILGFRKNYYRIGRHIDRFGKNILITDHVDWSTDEIVQASLDRYIVEQAFRQTKDDDLVSMFPIRHWTDSKIRCHFLSCIIALAYLRLIELKLEDAGIHMTAQRTMDLMRNLHSCLCWNGEKEKAWRMIEEPSPDQARVLAVFGYEVERGVLQKIKS
jgi:transposase